MPKPRKHERTSPCPTGRKIWWFRLLALIGAPVVFFGLLELGLRLCGYGHPTAFLMPSTNQGQKTFVQNNQFGWRFLGQQMSRVPHPISIPREKRPDTVRIFVLGESAAYGDPQPAFGLPRMLEAMLELRYPGMKFEVVNAAMTAINSHALVPIARDCAHAGGDIWVVYMGNNEVVGPFGAGTVFGLRAPPLSIVRANLAIGATRTGQLLDGLLSSSRSAKASDKSEWGGMTMFLKQTVRATDPLMNRVYANFQSNLADIIRAGRDSGAGVVVSTVAVNLEDCAPFASLHRPNLAESELAEWKKAFDAGVQAQQAGRWSDAAELFRSAARIDDAFAELRFRQGQCAKALGQIDEARTQFSAARDLDVLRFRCDSRLNDVIRRTAGVMAGNKVVLADSEDALAAASPNRITGSDLFYEHVHLTFEGNYLLARTIAEQVEKLLPGTVPPSKRPWPAIADCARRLGRTDRALQLALSEILSRVNDPPFTGQANHTEQQRRLITKARELPSPDDPGVLNATRAVCEKALVQWPGDASLYQQLAELKLAQSDTAGAVAGVKRSLELLPTSEDAWLLLGMALAQQNNFTEAADAFRHIFALDSEAVWGLSNLAACYDKMGRQEDAVRELKHALSIKPYFGTAWLGLYQIYEKMGRTNEASECFNQALTHRVHMPDYYLNLARACLQRHYIDAAITNFEDAIVLRPSDPGLLLEEAQTLVSAGCHTEAAQRYSDAIRLSPNQVQAHMSLGIELGRLGKHADAEHEFRESVRLTPDLAEPRLNLGIALLKQNKKNDALACFQEVLQRNPDNALARKYVQELSSQAQ